MSSALPASLSPRLVAAGIVGNILEWYDFAIYGYFAQVIGEHFFPSDNPATSVIAAFGAFAAGFLMRPLGGVVFGHIADRMGRKAALTASVLAMAIPTFLFGVLPDYAQIGIAAPILVFLLRMVQGLSVGGEFTTSMVFLVEAAPPGRRGWAGSWSAFGASAGTLLGSVVGALVSALFPAAALHSWAWRLPFLAGLAVGLGGLYLRRHVSEMPAEPAVEEHAHWPIVEAFRTEWRAIAQVIGYNLILAVNFYMAFVYVVTYLKEIVGVSSSEALDINSFNMVILLLVIPLAAALSDRVGRKPLLLVACLGFLVLAWPLFWMMHHPKFEMILLGQMGFAVLAALYGGALPAAMVETFPARVRCTAISVGYNLSVGLLGGTTPLVAAYLIERSHNDLSPAFYIMAAAALSLGVVLRLRETAHATLRL
jgi:MHS family proline/betaine transporter-like MFS transporter